MPPLLARGPGIEPGMRPAHPEELRTACDRLRRRKPRFAPIHEGIPPLIFFDGPQSHPAHASFRRLFQLPPPRDVVFRRHQRRIRRPPGRTA